MSNIFDKLSSNSSTKSPTAKSFTDKHTRANVTPKREDKTSRRHSDAKRSASAVSSPGSASSREDNVDSLHDEKFIDIESLKTFTIPKKKKVKRNLFEEIPINSREFVNDISNIIKQSFKDGSSSNNYKFTRARYVHNTDLLNAYSERRKHMRQNSYTEKEVGDSYFFLSVNDDFVIQKVCTEGLKVKTSQVSCLGNPEMGVYLSRHADLMTPAPFYKKQRGQMIVFKVMKGKVKTVVENKEHMIDPTPNFDCHISKNLSIDLSTTPHAQAHESTQIYLYEYDEDFDPLEVPRHMYPYLVVNFVYEGESKRIPNLKTSLKLGAARAGITPLMTSPTVGGPARGPKHRGTRTPQTSSAITSTQPTLPKLPPLTMTPSPTTPSTEHVLTWDPRQQSSSVPTDPRKHAVKPSAAASKPPLAPINTAPVSIPLSTTLAVVSAPGQPLQSTVGSDTPDNGMIVWCGQLKSEENVLANVELVSYTAKTRPARICGHLQVKTRIPNRVLQSQYFKHIPSLSQCKTKELHLQGKYINYAVMRPCAGSQKRFKVFLEYLGKKQSAAVVKLEDSEIVMMCDSELSQDLGLSEVGMKGIHCVFLSKTSRVETLENHRKKSPTTVLSGDDQNIRYTPPNTGIHPSTAIPGREKLAQVFAHQDFTDPALRSGAFGDVDMRRPGAANQLGAAFRDPPPPTRILNPLLDSKSTAVTLLKAQEEIKKQSHFDEGFENRAPAKSWIFRDNLSRCFVEQMSVQDNCNLQLARKSTPSSPANTSQNSHVQILMPPPSTSIPLSPMVTPIMGTDHKVAPSIVPLMGTTDRQYTDPRLIKKPLLSPTGDNKHSRGFESMQATHQMNPPGSNTHPPTPGYINSPPPVHINPPHTGGAASSVLSPHVQQHKQGVLGNPPQHGGGDGLLPTPHSLYPNMNFPHHPAPSQSQLTTGHTPAVGHATPAIGHPQLAAGHSPTIGHPPAAGQQFNQQLQQSNLGESLSVGTGVQQPSGTPHLAGGTGSTLHPPPTGILSPAAGSNTTSVPTTERLNPQPLTIQHELHQTQNAIQIVQNVMHDLIKHQKQAEVPAKEKSKDPIISPTFSDYSHQSEEENSPDIKSPLVDKPTDSERPLSPGSQTFLAKMGKDDTSPIPETSATPSPVDDDYQYESGADSESDGESVSEQLMLDIVLRQPIKAKAARQKALKTDSLGPEKTETVPKITETGSKSGARKTQSRYTIIEGDSKETSTVSQTSGATSKTADNICDKRPEPLKIDKTVIEDSPMSPDSTTNIQETGSKFTMQSHTIVQPSTSVLSPSSSSIYASKPQKTITSTVEYESPMSPDAGSSTIPIKSIIADSPASPTAQTPSLLKQVLKPTAYDSASIVYESPQSPDVVCSSTTKTVHNVEMMSPQSPDQQSNIKSAMSEILSPASPDQTNPCTKLPSAAIMSPESPDDNSRISSKSQVLKTMPVDIASPASPDPTTQRGVSKIMPMDIISPASPDEVSRNSVKIRSSVDLQSPLSPDDVSVNKTGAMIIESPASPDQLSNKTIQPIATEILSPRSPDRKDIRVEPTFIRQISDKLDCQPSRAGDAGPLRESVQGRSSERDVSRETERRRSRDRSRERDRLRSRDTSRDRLISRDGSRERLRSRDGSRERLRSRDLSRDRERLKPRDSSIERDRLRSRDDSIERDRLRSRGSSRDRDRIRSRDASTERNSRRSRERDTRRRSPERARSRNRDSIRSPERARSRDRDFKWSPEKIHSRDRDYRRSPGRARSRERDNRSPGRSRDRSKDRGYRRTPERGRNRSRERVRGRSRDRDYRSPRGRSQDRDYRRSRSREREIRRSRERDFRRSRSLDRDYRRERSRERETRRSRERDEVRPRERSRDRGTRSKDDIRSTEVTRERRQRADSRDRNYRTSREPEKSRDLRIARDFRRSSERDIGRSRDGSRERDTLRSREDARSSRQSTDNSSRARMSRDSEYTSQWVLDSSLLKENKSARVVESMASSSAVPDAQLQLLKALYTPKPVRLESESEKLAKMKRWATDAKTCPDAEANSSFTFKDHIITTGSEVDDLRVHFRVGHYGRSLFTSKNKDDELRWCCGQALHDNANKKPTAKESEFTEFISLALHYLLPVISFIDPDSRNIVGETEKMKKLDCLDKGRGGRYHPYRKELKQLALTVYEEFQRLNWDCSSVGYRAMTEKIKERASMFGDLLQRASTDYFGPPRFKDVSIRRTSVDQIQDSQVEEDLVDRVWQPDGEYRDRVERMRKFANKSETKSEDKSDAGPSDGRRHR